MMEPIISDDVAAKFAVNVFTEIFKKSISSLESFEGWVKGKYKEHDPLGIAAKKYADQIEYRYNCMQIFGMTQPVPLRNIYVRVNVLSEISAFQAKTTDELEMMLNERGEFHSTKSEPLEGINAANKKENEKLVILGKPGAGKTTFLQYLALSAIDQKLIVKRIPVFISLKQWSDQVKEIAHRSLFDFIVKQFELCHFPDAADYIKRVLENGGFILLLDGFDEVTNEVERAIQAIRDFSDQYNKNQYVLSCRIAAYNYNNVLQHFTTVEMADFDDEQIEVFIHQWYGTDNDKAAMCWKELQEQPKIKELGSNPLLLTMLCINFNKTLVFPSNRSEIYRKAVDAFLSEWDASRTIRRKDVHEKLTLRNKETLLTKLAAIFFEKGKYFIPQKELEREIGNFIENLPDSDEAKIGSDSREILESIEAHHGLLIARAEGIYSFSHLTLHEYFTARYIVDNAANGSVGKLIQNHLFDEKWKEVVLLVGGILTKADGFLISTRKELTKAVSEDSKRYLYNLDQTINQQTTLQKFLHRQTILYFVIDALYYHYKVRDRDYARDHIRDYARDRTHALTIVRVFTHAQSRDLDHALEYSRGHALARDRARALNLSEKSVIQLFDSINETILNDFDKYFYGHELLITLLESDIYINKKTREELWEGLYYERV